MQCDDVPTIRKVGMWVTKLSCRTCNININIPLSYFIQLLPVYVKNEREITNGLIVYMYKTKE